MVTVVTYLEKWLCKAKKHVTSGVVTRWIRVVTMTEEKTMDFKQIEHSVLKFEPMPDNAPLHEQMCYFALRHLYEDYRRGVVNVQAAHDERGVSFVEQNCISRLRNMQDPCLHL